MIVQSSTIRIPPSYSFVNGFLLVIVIEITYESLKGTMLHAAFFLSKFSVDQGNSKEYKVDTQWSQKRVTIYG